MKSHMRVPLVCLVVITLLCFTLNRLRGSIILHVRKPTFNFRITTYPSASPLVVSGIPDPSNGNSDAFDGTPSEAGDVNDCLRNSPSLLSNLTARGGGGATEAILTPSTSTSSSPSMPLADKKGQQSHDRSDSAHSSVSRTTKRPVSMSVSVARSAKPNRIKKVPISVTKLIDGNKSQYSVFRQSYYGLRRKALDMTREWRVYRLRMDAYNKRIRKGLKAIRPIEPSPTPRPKPIVEDPNFNGMDPPAMPPVYHEYKRIEWKPSEMVRIRQFQGNEEVSFNDETVYPSHDQAYSVTYVAVGTYTRIFFIPHLLDRWKGPMCLVMYGMDYEEEKFLSYFSHRNYDSRLTMLLYLVRNGTEIANTFPINSLRNLGIRMSRSTHYIVFDMDVWPAMDLYDNLVNLHPSILNSEKSLVIVPIFFYDLGVMLVQCSSLSNCTKLGLEYFPNNVTALKSCVRARVCMFHKADVFTHGYTNRNWLNWSGYGIMEMRCVLNNFQEPYVMLRRSPNTPLFDERFVNYGYNKVQLIEHLRYLNYHFLILMNSFAMDTPHRNSKFSQSFRKNLNTTDPMTFLIEVYREELKTKYGATPALRECRSSRVQFYKQVDIRVL